MSDSSFQPIAPNPYIVGNPVRSPDMFFGREAEFDLVQKRFRSSRRNGALMVFCGERRSGKTSILLQIQQGRLGPDYIPILIDMQAMAVSREVEFLDRIASEILAQVGHDRALDPPRFDEGTKAAAVFRSFIEHVMAALPDKKLILLFDEYELFEDKIDGGQLTKDVLLILANLIETLPIFIVFTGSQHLEERKRDYWRLLEKAHEYRRISYLHLHDATKLIREPVAGRVTFADDTIDTILRLTAGQPFYTQAICQNLVDYLNESQSTLVTQDAIDSVVGQIVEHPFPQMTFLWDTLPRDQKLALALLAESADDADSARKAEQLNEHLKANKYPLNLGVPAIATALETLFKQELLSKSEANDGSFVFRMDLWRLWIRRMHSVWQVMREENLDFRKSRPRRTTIGVLLFVLLVLGYASYEKFLATTPPPTTPPPPVSVPQGHLWLTTTPKDAFIELIGHTVGQGDMISAVSVGDTYSVRITRDGYVDSTLQYSVPVEGDTLQNAIVLRRRTGGLHVRVDPPEAMIRLNGTDAGTSEVVHRGLPIDETISVRATLLGYVSESREVELREGEVSMVALTLRKERVRVTLIVDPPDARVFVDDRAIEPGTNTVTVDHGDHVFRATLTGFQPARVSQTITSQQNLVRLSLARAPDGNLVFRGDDWVIVYVDGSLVGSGEIRASKPTPFRPGPHEIEIRFRDGNSQTITVDVDSEETKEIVWEDGQLREQD